MAGVDGVKGQAGASKDLRDLRRYSRYTVDGGSATLLLVDLGLKRECKVIDLSREGCQVQFAERFPGSAGVRVETVFKVNGIAFRFNGIVRWVKRQQLAGIQFINTIARCRKDLAGLIEEMESAAELEPAGARADPPREFAKAGEEEEAAPLVLEPAAVSTIAAPTKPDAIAASAQPSKADRRAHVRQQVDTSATIILVRGGSALAGRIVDLSPGGCRIKTVEKFPLGIYTRVEVEFHLNGLPFRLGGVIQAVHNSTTVGIRFLDLSERKRAQVAELIEEIARTKQEAEAAVAPEAAL